LDELNRSGDINPSWQTWNESGHVETLIALMKYFSIHKSNDPWSDIQKIMFIYKKVEVGLKGPYNIVLYAKKATEHGYVPAPPGSLEKALDAYMNPSADSDGHITWSPVRTGDIHLNFTWLKLGSVPADQVARCIVHEASHKWGHTADLLYKSTSLLALDDESRDTAVLVGAAERILMERKPEGFIPMNVDVQPFVHTQLMANADSYAWAARRIWKRKIGAMPI
jgi:hypothetical protein